MKKKSLIIFLSIIGVLVALGAISLVSYSVSKYYSEKNYQSQMVSDKFYFTVDLLGDTNLSTDFTKTYHLYGGDSKEIKFNVLNYFDNLRINQSDITYSVELSGTGISFATINDVSGSLTGKTKSSKELVLNINDQYKNDDVVTVTIKSTAPYSKTLVLNFVLHTYASDLTLTINDSENSLYAEMILSCNVDVQAYLITIDYSEINASSNALGVDLTNEYLIDSSNTNSVAEGEYLKSIKITKEISAGSGVSIYMFKENILKDFSKCKVDISTSVVGGITYFTIKITEEAGE